MQKSSHTIYITHAAACIERVNKSDLMNPLSCACPVCSHDAVVDPESEDKVHVAVDGLGGKFVVLYVGKKEGKEKEKLLADDRDTDKEEEEEEGGLWSRYIRVHRFLKPSWGRYLGNLFHDTITGVMSSVHFVTSNVHSFELVPCMYKCCKAKSQLRNVRTLTVFASSAVLYDSDVSAIFSLSLLWLGFFYCFSFSSMLAPACLGRKQNQSSPTRWLPMRGSTSSPLRLATSTSGSFAS